MNWPKTTIAALYGVATVIILWNLYMLIITREVWTDSLYTGYDQTVLLLKTLFLLAIGAALLRATHQRSRYVIAILLAALLYLIVFGLLNVIPLAQFYLFNTSGWSGYRILAVVAAPHVAQIAVALILLFASRKLRTLGQLS